jgi:tartrate-resistant acid phosphatase type 5
MGIGRRGFLTGSAAALGVLGTAGPAVASTPKFDLPDSETLRVLVIGDTGTGDRPQWAVADALRTLHAREPFDLAVCLGDNIYWSGPGGDNDPQFAAKFENPYHDLDFPWLMAQGNHDNSSILPGDGSWLARGDFEVGYHAHSPRWYMPRRYYSVAVPAAAPVAEFFVLDVNPLAAYIPVLAPYWAPDGQFVAEQRDWLDAAIAGSRARWTFVCTHHPFLNNGPHGDAGHYESLSIDPIDGVHLQRFFADHVAGRVPFLLSGHDHSLQVLEPTIESRGTRQLISGAGALSVHDEPAEPRSTATHPSLYENFLDLGFMALELTRDRADLHVYTVDLPTAVPTRVFERRL